MAEIWPGTLSNHILIDGYSETAPNNMIRSKMDEGPPDQDNSSYLTIRYQPTLSRFQRWRKWQMKKNAHKPFGNLSTF